MNTDYPDPSSDFFFCLGQVRATAEAEAAQYARSHKTEVTLLLDCTGQYYMTDRSDWDLTLFVEAAHVRTTGAVETIVPVEIVRRRAERMLADMETLRDHLVVLRETLRITGTHTSRPRLLRYSTAAARALAKIDDAWDVLGDVRAWVQVADGPSVPEDKR